MNKMTREDIPVNQLSNGQVLEVKKFELKGDEPGLHVHIQASVHGAEVQGNPVIWELLNFFSKAKIKGSITLMPMVNPWGSNTKTGTYTQGRFNPVTGDNWNRNFINLVGYDQEVSQFNLDTFWENNKDKNHQEQVTNFKKLQVESFHRILEALKEYGISDNREMNIKLQALAARADLVLDLHTGPAATRYLYAGEYALKKMKDIPFPHNLIIPNEYGGAMDEATFFPWTELTRVAHEAGDSFVNSFESYTVELGSEEIIDSTKARTDAARLLTLLAARGIINYYDLEKHYGAELSFIKNEKKYACLLKNYATYYLQQGGLVEYIKGPGDHITAGEDLYKVLDFSHLHSFNDLEKCYQTIKANKDGIIINHTPSASVTKGTIAYQVMEEYYEI